jgi:hypothetical protein
MENDRLVALVEIPALGWIRRRVSNHARFFLAKIVMPIFKKLFGLVFAACVLTAGTGDEVEIVTVPTVPEPVVWYENQFTREND